MIRRTACLIARDNDLYRNLAIEKHLMDTLPDETAILFLWQARHAIVIGRNQNPWSECDVSSFLSAGGQFARRLSGGAAMYEDMGSLQYTLILPKTQFDIPRQLSMIGMSAGAFGVQCRAGRRSSLCINGRVFAHTAFYKSGSMACQQGCIHLATDLDRMQRFMSGNQARDVINLAQLVPSLTLSDLSEALYWAFGNTYGTQPAMLDERMFNERELEKTAMWFMDGGWTYPRQIPPTFTVSERFPWGDVTVLLRTEGGVIREARLFSDAMEAGLFPLIEKALTGAPMLISSIAARINQQLSMLRDPILLQIAADVENLIARNLRGR